MTASRRDPPVWLAVLKVAKVPFWLLWLAPPIYAYLAASEGRASRNFAWWIAGVIGVCLLEAAGCFHNELVDAEEDRVNQPDREHLLRTIGRRRAWILVAFGYGFCAVGLAIFAVVNDWRLALVLLVGGSAAPLYNWGPHFKWKPSIAPLTIGVAVVAVFCAGWGLNRPLPSTSSVAYVLGVLIAVTEWRGEPLALAYEPVPSEAVNPYRQAAFPVDEVMGVADGGRWVFGLRRLVSPTVLSMLPYALLSALVAGGVLPLRFLWFLVLVPAPVLLAALRPRVTGRHAMIVCYEAGFLYQFVAELLLLVLLLPTATGWLLAAGLLAARTAAVLLGLAPRFAEQDFRWSEAISTDGIRALAGRSAAGVEHSRGAEAGA